MVDKTKLLLIVQTFLENPNLSIQELAELDKLEGISKSTIQRYLNNSSIIEVFNQETYNKIQELLSSHKLSGKRKGGLNSFKNNKSLKDSKGRFIGNVSLKDDKRVLIKCQHILSFASIFITYPDMSLQEIADFYNINHPEQPVTRDYVYDCLTSREKYDLLSYELWKKIDLYLENRRLLGNKNGAIASNQCRKK